MKFKKLFALGLAGVISLSLAACGDTVEAPPPEEAQEQAKTIALTESWDFSFGFYPVVTEDRTNNYAAGY